MGKVWEGFCTLCICAQCKVKPRLGVVAVTSALFGLLWIGLGVWLAVIVYLNSVLTSDEQIYFEKLHLASEDDRQMQFVNESSFVWVPLDNIKFYLYAMSFISILGGLGRTIASLSLLHHICKKTLSYILAWAWVVLSLLSISSLAILTVDTLFTLSHTDLTPSQHSRDFYFKNDHLGMMYNLCHVFKYLIIIDFISVLYFQWVVRWAQRNPLFTSPPI